MNHTDQWRLILSDSICLHINIIHIHFEVRSTVCSVLFMSALTYKATCFPAFRVFFAFLRWAHCLISLAVSMDWIISLQAT